MASALEQHDNQWPKIENGGKCFRDVLKKLRGDDAVKYFTESEVFATVKFDGTNVAKCAKSGKLLGRRTYIDPEATTYMKTSLDPVKQADAEGLMNKILEGIEIQDRTSFGEFIVYGELICNNYYNYGDNGMVGTWQVFGAVLEDNSGGQEVFEKLLNAGYAVRIMTEKKKEKKKDTKSGKQIQFLMNKELYDISKSCGLTVAPRPGEGKTIDVIVNENKDWLKNGQGEGIVITLGNKEKGFRMVKWKGGHEAQDKVDWHIQHALDKLKTMNIDEKVTSIFNSFKEVIDEGAKNKESTVSGNKLKNKPGTDEKANQNMDESNQKSSSEKEVLVDEAIRSALTKFDSPSVYIEKGEAETKKFKELLIAEVKNDTKGQASPKLIAKKINSLKLDNL